MITRIELTNFRCYRNEVIELNPGVTAVLGLNGHGKTSLAEAMSYLSTLKSFRGVPNEALVRDGEESAYIRAMIVHDDGREILVEAEINREGRNKVLINKQRLTRTKDLLGVVRCTVFAPTDLRLVYEGPSVRRGMLDDALVSLAPRNDALCTELDRILRQRNVLLKQAFGRLTPEIEMTLDVWDQKLVDVGTRLGNARTELVNDLRPLVQNAYQELAEEHTVVDIVYEPEWRDIGLEAAVKASRAQDVRRALSTVGPHRDDVVLKVKNMPARSHASQGECRTLALALRFGIHQLVTDAVGQAPLLVLDDVLSELDPRRCGALLRHIPPGQVLITTAHPLPKAAHPDSIIRISEGVIVPLTDTDGTSL